MRISNLSFQFSDEVDQLARNLGCRLIRTSVKEDVNVSSVFRYLASKCHQIMMQQYNVVPVGQPTISKYQKLSKFQKQYDQINVVRILSFALQVHLVQRLRSQKER